MEKFLREIRRTPETNTHLLSWATPPGSAGREEANQHIDVVLNNNSVLARGHFGIDQEETHVAQ